MFKNRLLLVLVSLTLLSTAAPLADTVELVDGSLLEGRYVGGNRTTVMFETAGEIAALETSAVVAVYFTAVGAGASILSSGNSNHIPAGTLVETSLRSPLGIR
jgi:hypothetical protein